MYIYLYYSIHIWNANFSVTTQPIFKIYKCPIDKDKLLDFFCILLDSHQRVGKPLKHFTRPADFIVNKKKPVLFMLFVNNPKMSKV